MLQWIYAPRIEEAAAAHLGNRGAGGWLRSWTVERRRQKLRRDAIATLLRVDDDVLRDITGLERHQVEAAARLPLEVDALDRLRRMRAVEVGPAGHATAGSRRRPGEPASRPR
ncbi:hypothetical protein [Aurantimonas sp. 22II-16-19i]|uniref:hypothetical protein n=1 Tax=Aurantimonas sp. 22II-16-19i TaxID=1317114 RepID=UPI0009F7A1B4|nr:hypothetical protein [Aurantimonas sp. 22II-16-19i]ORE98343.1 hypothetical protein ATO4_05147 [Aurantimonas sp. 22II-16-19i]